METLARLEWFMRHRIFLLFLHEHRYLNPLLAQDFTILKQTNLLLENSTLHTVIHKDLPHHIQQLPQGMFFPVPIARAMDTGSPFSLELACKFHYDFIYVNHQHQWFLKKTLIVGKVKELFVSHLAYDAPIERYFVEYQVEGRWDKCYLDCEITPIILLQITLKPDGTMWGILNNGQQDQVDPYTFRMDLHEHCFCKTLKYGEAFLADAPRYFVLEKLDDDGRSIKIESYRYPLSQTST